MDILSEISFCLSRLAILSTPYFSIKVVFILPKSTYQQVCEVKHRDYIKNAETAEKVLAFCKLNIIDSSFVLDSSEKMRLFENLFDMDAKFGDVEALDNILVFDDG